MERLRRFSVDSKSVDADTFFVESDTFTDNLDADARISPRERQSKVIKERGYGRISGG